MKAPATLAVSAILLLTTALGCNDDTPASPADARVVPDLASPDLGVPDLTVPDAGSTAPADMLPVLCDGMPSSDGPLNGYVLYTSAIKSTERPIVVIMDMNGNVIKEWTLVGFPGLYLPGGSVIGGSGKFVPPGLGLNYLYVFELVQQDWSGKVGWSFRNWQKWYSQVEGTSVWSARQHHSYRREGNPVGYYAPGQLEKLSGDTLVLASYKHNVAALGGVQIDLDDAIYMVDSKGQLGSFKWYALDHFNEYGFAKDASDYIKKITSTASYDILHINSMVLLGKNHWYDGGDKRFDPQNIMVGARAANFIAIIDHQTGKVVWRVGPDMGTGQPGEKIGQIVGQHFPHMIPYGLPGAGNILLFDNGGQSGYGGAKGYPKYSRNYTRILEFNPVTLEKVWQYGGPAGDPGYFLSVSVGSAQRLLNGNTMFLIPQEQRVIQVNKQGKRVWTLEIRNKDRGWMDGLAHQAILLDPGALPAGANKAGYSSWNTLLKLAP